MALAPELPANPYVYVLYTYDAAIGGIAPRGGGRRTATSDGCPTRPARPATAASSAGGCPGSRRRATSMTGHRAGPDRGLVPAVPQPLDRDARVRSGRCAVRRAAGTARASTSSTTGRTASRSTRAATRREASGATLTRPPPRAARSAARTSARAATRWRSTAPILRVDPATGAGAARQPARRQRRPERATDHRLRPAQSRSGSRSGPGRTSSGSATSAGTTGRRSTGSPNPTDAVVENFGWPCYEGTGRQSGLRRREPEHLREPLRARRAPIAPPYYTYNHGDQVVTGETCPTGSSSIAGSRSTGRHLPGRLRQRPVLRRLLARLHLGDVPRRERAARTPRTVQRSSKRRGEPGGAQDRPGRRPLLRRLRRRHDPADPVRGGNQPPTAVATAIRRRRRTADGEVRRDGLERSRSRRHARPTRGIWTATASSTTRTGPGGFTRSPARNLRRGCA